MTDKPKSSSKPKKERAFPILNFANLLDEFLEDHSDLDEGTAAVVALKEAVSDALLEHVKHKKR